MNCLKYYPNIVDYFGAEDKTLSKKRLSDLKASLTRQKIFYNSENQNSLKDLRIKIHFKRNNSKEFDRIFSLNLGFASWPIEEVIKIILSLNSSLLSIWPM